MSRKGWLDGSSPGAWGTSYRVIQTDTAESAFTRWTWTPEVSGRPVYMWYVAGEKSQSVNIVAHREWRAFRTVQVDQTEQGSRWVYLGTFPFQANQRHG